MVKRSGSLTLGRALLVTGATIAMGYTVFARAGDELTPPSSFSERCGDLARSSRSDLRIGSAEVVIPAVEGDAAAGPPLPIHCRVNGVINPRTGVGDREFGIGFELRLPEEWNGRFLFQGGSGLDGVVQPAIGTIANSAKPPALAQGFAVVSTDAGHSGSPVDATFGLDQQARIDYAYNALDKVTVEAKRMVEGFFGRAPRYSYMLGCSNGGRQAMTFSQRMPLYYDGIVGGSPAMRFSGLAIGQVWNQGVVARIAPRDAEGRPIASRAFSDADLELVRTQVLQRCDTKDGLADGMINDWRGCGFDPSELTCRPGQTGDCLSAAQVGALRDLYAGPRAVDGRHVYGPFTFDTGIASPAWRGIKLGTSQTSQTNSGDSMLGTGQVRYLQLSPPDPAFDPLAAWDLETILQRVRSTGAMTDADSPHLSTFARTGKMILYNGNSDQGMATEVIADWYEQMIAATGEPGRDAVRFFAVPGMLHCGGGEATDQFEMLDAIMAWVEQGIAPDRIVATSQSMAGVSRPLCPYPKVARYKGGDPNAADSFECSA